MNVPTWNKTSPHIDSGLIRRGPRCVLRGEVSDESGKGKFVFSRQRQAWFCETVDYDIQCRGISAINTFSDPEITDDQGSDVRFLESRYSVIAETGCKVDHLRISLSAVDASFIPVRISLTWRGDGLAKFVDLDNQVVARDNGSFIRQNETLIIECGSAHNNTWHVEVPSHSVSLEIQFKDEFSMGDGGGLSINADTVFADETQSNDILVDGTRHPGTGKIQPKKVLEIIELVENGNEQTLVDDVEKPYNSNENKLIYSTPETLIDGDTEHPKALPSKIDVVVSQKIVVFHGEDIILGTESMFTDRVTGNVSYISANLPDWLFLDQINGDLMGTVPIHDNDEEDLEFSIYAVDGTGHSAKAVILINCSVPINRSTEELKDYEYYEGDQVSIETKAMFVDFGIDVEDLLYSVMGLPEGLSIKQDDGSIGGQIMYGTAVDGPYEIVVTVSGEAAVGSNISMRFLLNVVESNYSTDGMSSSYLPDAMNDLYRMNKDRERILVANLATDGTGIANGFSTREMLLSTDRLKGRANHTVVPMVRAFVPERDVYLQVHGDCKNDAENSKFKYEFQLPNKTQLPDWIEFTLSGSARIRCNPDRRYIDLELVQSGDDGFRQIFDICVDTFEGKLLPVFHQPDSFLEKQLQEVSVA